MAFPDPVPSLVIRYSYLWHSESVFGSEEGVKDRPCAIIAAVKAADGLQRVLVLPVTHSKPKDSKDAIEIPPDTKKRLGLDSERSWVVIKEWNEFSWPGPDLRMMPGGDEKTVAYGYLPAKFFNKVRDAFVEMIQSGSAKMVKRTS